MIDPPEPPFAPLSPEETALVRAEQNNVRAPDDARRRVLARLAVGLPALSLQGLERAGDGASGPPPVPPSPVAAVAESAARLTSLKLVAVLAVGGAVGAGGHALVAPAPERIVYVDRVVYAPPAARPATATAIAPPSAAPPIAAAAPRPSSSSSSATLDRASSLAEERGLLDAARNAIMRGQPDLALAPLEAHQARFPRGELAEEREALAIKALARVGRADDARARAALFRQKFPQSLLLDGVESDLRRNP